MTINLFTRARRFTRARLFTRARRFTRARLFTRARRFGALALGAGAAWAAVHAPAINAAQYSVDPGASAELRFDDTRGTNRDGDRDGRTTARYALWTEFKAETGRTVFTVRPLVRLRRFSNDADSDSDDQELDVNYVLTGQRYRFETPFTYDRDTTSSIEFVEADTSLNLVARSSDARRVRTSVQPQLTVAATERLTIGGQVGIADTDFGTSDSLTDFRSYNGQLSANYVLSERVTLLGATSALFLESPDAARDPESTTLTATVGGSYALNPTLTLTVTAGATTTRRQQDASATEIGSDRENGLTGRIAIRQELQRGRLDLSLGRSRSPTVSGVLVESDALLFNARYDVTERLLATALVDLSTRDSLSFDPADDDESLDRLVTGLALRYRLTDAVSLGTTYRYLYRDTSTSTDNNDRHYLTFSLTYDGRPFSFSR